MIFFNIELLFYARLEVLDVGGMLMENQSFHQWFCNLIKNFDERNGAESQSWYEVNEDACEKKKRKKSRKKNSERAKKGKYKLEM